MTSCGPVAATWGEHRARQNILRINQFNEISVQNAASFVYLCVARLEWFAEVKTFRKA